MNITQWLQDKFLAGRLPLISLFMFQKLIPLRFEVLRHRYWA